MTATIVYHPRQTGLGPTGVLASLAALALAMTLLVRVVPLYLEHWALREVLDGLAEAPPLVEDARQLRLIILRRLAINEVRDVHAEQIEIVPAKDHWQVRVRYQAEAPLTGTLSLVARFDEQARIPRNPPS